MPSGIKFRKAQSNYRANFQNNPQLPIYALVNRKNLSIARQTAIVSHISFCSPCILFEQLPGFVWLTVQVDFIRCRINVEKVLLIGNLATESVSR